MSPVETWCHNLNYYIPDEEGVTKDFTAENMTRIRKFDKLNCLKPSVSSQGYLPNHKP